MDIRKMELSGLFSVIVDLWRSMSESGNENILRDYLDEQGLTQDEINNYIESLEKFVFKNNH
jgi:hypothetical protein